MGCSRSEAGVQKVGRVQEGSWAIGETLATQPRDEGFPVNHASGGSSHHNGRYAQFALGTMIESEWERHHHEQQQQCSKCTMVMKAMMIITIAIPSNSSSGTAV